MSDAALERLAMQAGLTVHWTHASGEPRRVGVDTLRRVLEALGYPAASAAAISDSHERLAADIARAPRRASVRGRAFTVAELGPARQRAGLAVQLYALRGGHTADFGDFAALGEFATEAAQAGIQAVAISPTHAGFLADPGRLAPYSPSSRDFLNPLYADVALAGGAPDRDNGADGLIDWSSAGPAKLAQLRAAFDRQRDTTPPDDLMAFCRDGGDALLRHALFDALDGHFRARGLMGWRNWPAPFRDPASTAVAAFRQSQDETVAFHLFLQWLTRRSRKSAQAAARAAGMAVGLISDVAVGMDPNGSQAWSQPADVLQGVTIGAPPDIFNPQGQNWGLTTFSPLALARSGAAAFAATLRASMQDSGGIRLDHAMGLERLWVIPEGAGPEDGVYLRYPTALLLDAIVRESRAQRAIVIAEDLGTVPGGFRGRLARRGILGMEVLWFQRHGDRFLPPARWHANAVAMTTTHDLPTLAGWWCGHDLDWQETLGRLPDRRAAEAARDADRRRLWHGLSHRRGDRWKTPPPDAAATAVDAALAFIARTPSPLSVVAVEDVLGLVEQPNIPGTIDEHPNWRRRLPAGSTLAAPGTRARLAILAGAATP